METPKLRIPPSFEDFKFSAAKIWGRIRGVASYSEPQLKNTWKEIENRFQIKEEVSEYKKIAFIIYLAEEILASRNPNYVPAKDNPQFVKPEKDLSQRTLRRKISESKRRKREREEMRLAIIRDLADSPEGVYRFQELQRQLDHLGPLMKTDEMGEAKARLSQTDFYKLEKEQLILAKRRHIILDEMSLISETDVREGFKAEDTDRFREELKQLGYLV